MNGRWNYIIWSCLYPPPQSWLGMVPVYHQVIWSINKLVTALASPRHLPHAWVKQPATQCKNDHTLADSPNPTTIIPHIYSHP